MSWLLTRNCRVKVVGEGAEKGQLGEKLGRRWGEIRGRYVGQWRERGDIRRNWRERQNR